MSEAGEGETAGETEAGEWSSLLYGRTLLVIEDSLVSRSILVRILQSAGAETEEATNGYEGLALMRKAFQSKTPIDVIICDIMMPEMDGFEFLEQARKRPEGEKAAIVMLTAKSDKDSVIYCMKHGVAGYIRKPFKQGRVVQTLLDVIVRHESKDAAEPTEEE